MATTGDFTLAIDTRQVEESAIPADHQSEPHDQVADVSPTSRLDENGHGNLLAQSSP